MNDEIIAQTTDTQASLETTSNNDNNVCDSSNAAISTDHYDFAKLDPKHDMFDFAKCKRHVEKIRIETLNKFAQQVLQIVYNAKQFNFPIINFSNYQLLDINILNNLTKAMKFIDNSNTFEINLTNSLSAIHTKFIRIDKTIQIPKEIKISLINFLQSFPQNIKTINLSMNRLFQIKPVDDLIDILNSIPTSVKSVILNNNGVIDMPYLELYRLIRCTEKISSINMSFQDMRLNYKQCIGNFINLFGIDFSNEDLRKLTNNIQTLCNINSIVKNLPKNIKYINMSNCNLGNLTTEQLIELFISIPPHIQHICFNNNKLNNIFSLHNAVRYLPNTLMFVDFESNNLGCIEHISMHELISAMHYSTIFFNTKNNYLPENTNNIYTITPISSPSMLNINSFSPKPTLELNISSTSQTYRPSAFKPFNQLNKDNENEGSHQQSLSKRLKIQIP